MKRIIYTRRDGGVCIITPASQCFKALTHGGGLIVDRGMFERQVEALIAEGKPSTIAKRWVQALAFGGLTNAEAYGLIRDKDMGKDGVAPELLDVSDIPQDRWFRDAWRRSHNGGPVYIDMDTARRIQAERIYSAFEAWKKERKKEESISRLSGGLFDSNQIDTTMVGDLISKCEHPDHLKTIWPKGLPQQ